MNPQCAQSVGVQFRILPTAQAVKPKLQMCNECGVSGAEERRLFPGTHAFCITYPVVRYKFELESLKLCRPSNITGSLNRKSVSRVLNNDQPVDGHVPISLNDAILYATVQTRDQVSR